MKITVAGRHEGKTYSLVHELVTARTQHEANPVKLHWDSKINAKGMRMAGWKMKPMRPFTGMIVVAYERDRERLLQDYEDVLRPEEVVSMSAISRGDASVRGADLILVDDLDILLMMQLGLVTRATLTSANVELETLGYKIDS